MPAPAGPGHSAVLTEDGAKTTMTYVVEYPTGEMHDAAAAMPMKEAINTGYDKLAEYLTRSTPQPGATRTVTPG